MHIRVSAHLLDDTQRATACFNSLYEFIHLLLPVFAFGLCMQDELHAHLVLCGNLQGFHQGCCMETTSSESLMLNKQS